MEFNMSQKFTSRLMQCADQLLSCVTSKSFPQTNSQKALDTKSEQEPEQHSSKQPGGTHTRDRNSILTKEHFFAIKERPVKLSLNILKY